MATEAVFPVMGYQFPELRVALPPNFDSDVAHALKLRSVTTVNGDARGRLALDCGKLTAKWRQLIAKPLADGISYVGASLIGANTAQLTQQIILGWLCSQYGIKQACARAEPGMPYHTVTVQEFMLASVADELLAYSKLVGAPSEWKHIGGAPYEPRTLFSHFDTALVSSDIFKRRISEHLRKHNDASTLKKLLSAIVKGDQIELEYRFNMHKERD